MMFFAFVLEEIDNLLEEEDTLVNPKFYAINVGRGDAFVLEVPADGRSYFVLVDGGDYAKHEVLLTFFNTRKITSIDLLILTHLHPDHLGGLLPVAENFEIVEAVLPYPEFMVNTGAAAHPAAKETQQVFQDYGHLCQLLKRQGTTISVRSPFGAQKSWVFGNTRLRHLYPLRKEDLKGYPLIQELSQEVFLDSREQLLVKFDGLANFDSSIWMVEDMSTNEEWLALGGDALLPSWQTLLTRERLSPYALKISHHGMEDAFNGWLLQELNPQWLLITTNLQEYEQYRHRWENLSRLRNSRLFVLGQDQATKWLDFTLPGEPQIE